MKPRLIVLITYNPCADFFDQYKEMLNYNFIIVDNSDCLEQSIICNLKQFSNVQLIQNHKNLGIAEALNIACDKAIELEYEYAITMDQDSLINDEIIGKLVSYYYGHIQDNIAIVSPLHVMQGGVKNNVAKDAEVTHGINTMTSGNLLILDIWKKLGGFNKDLFIDMVDVDFYCRAMIAGYNVITLNNVTMEHKLGEMQVINVGRFKLKVFNHSPIRKYYQIRNSLYILKNYSFYDFGVIRLITRFLFHSVMGIFLEESKLIKIKMIAYGVIDFCQNKYGKYKL